ncbi:MAG: response regulator transcription factor [Bacteroidetes bacterium]|nr:response regulator transcription factor [Bacteroidota bacterium]
MKQILIIEDEKPNADRLKRMLKAIKPKAEIVAVIDSVEESVAWFNEHQQPDVVMMDVRLSDGLSFEIFEKTKIECPVIFTTAYDEYAVRAFKYNSIDYLLKPIEQDELKTAIEKLESLNTGGVNQKSLEGLLNFLQPKDFRNRFLLPYRDGYKTVLVRDVAYFYSEQKISKAKLNNGAMEILPQTMEELEQQLNPKSFFRANRQYIIHIDAVQQVHNYFNGKLKIALRNNPDAEIIVSREKAHLLKNWLDY